MPLMLQHEGTTYDYSSLAIHKGKKYVNVILTSYEEILEYYTKINHTERETDLGITFTSNVKFLDINKLGQMLMSLRVIENCYEYDRWCVDLKQVFNDLMPRWNKVKEQEQLSMFIEFFNNLLPSKMRTHKGITDTTKEFFRSNQWIIENLMKDKCNREDEWLDYITDCIDDTFGIGRVEKKLWKFVYSQQLKIQQRKEKKIALIIHTINTACFNPHCELGVKMFNFRLKQDGLDEYYGE